MDFEPPAVLRTHELVGFERSFAQVAGKVRTEVGKRVVHSVLVAKRDLGAVGFEHFNRADRNIVRPANLYERRQGLSFFILQARRSWIP
jgi:hypothetical protein